MTGGKLNLSSHSIYNNVLIGNPSKSFFKFKYNKYSDFGLQRFKINCLSSNSSLRLNEDTVLLFTIPKYGDLLMDSTLSFELPDIWSPLHNPTLLTNNKWIGYEFKWIEDIGTQMIKNIEILCGSKIIQTYSGTYLSLCNDRDLSTEKKTIFNNMTGNCKELYDPANAYSRCNAYPSAYYQIDENNNSITPEPSIRGRILYIPLNTWYSKNSNSAFPLKSLRNLEIQIKITIRPIFELFRVRDINNNNNFNPYIRPDMTNEIYQMYRFLQPPPSIYIDTDSNSYINKDQSWDNNAHIISTYCFLSDEESTLFNSSQSYLIKEIVEHKIFNVIGTQKIRLPNSKGLVANWMFYLQRNDISLRNEWNNYSNWPYSALPSNIIWAPSALIDDKNKKKPILYGPGLNYTSNNVMENTGLYITDKYYNGNHKNILHNIGIILDGIVREDLHHSGVYNYIEKYNRFSGNIKDGVYLYNFALYSSDIDCQPSGAINLSFFNRIELEINTFLPDVDKSYTVPFYIECDSVGNAIEVTRKKPWEIYEYHYNFVLFEEKYNIVTISNGEINLMMQK